MKKILLSILILSFLVIGPSAFAQNSANLPDSGLTPDSHFYFLKTWKESIQTFFTFGAENKAKQFLHLSEVRLAEYLKMIEKGKIAIAQKTLEKYKKQLNWALEKSDEKAAINEKILEHQEILENILEKAPETAKPEIEKAIEASKEATLKMVEERLKQAPPEMQDCVKSIMSNLREKVKSGDFKGESDLPAILQGCLPEGTKIPSIPSGGGLNMESLKYIEEYYGKSLSPKDLESLKKAQEQLKGVIPQGTEIPPSQKTLNLEDMKNIQEKMQKDLEEQYKKMTPEELEYLKKMQEQGQYENATPPEIQGGGSGTGMGM